MQRLRLRITLEIFLRRKMIAAALLMVASAHIVGKRDLFLGVDIPAEATLLVAGGASVPCSHSFVWLENESVCIIHRFSKNRFALSALSAFWRLKMPKVQKMQVYSHILP